MNTDDKMMLAIVTVIAATVLTVLAMYFHHERKMAEMGYVPVNFGWVKDPQLTP